MQFCTNFRVKKERSIYESTSKMEWNCYDYYQYSLKLNSFLGVVVACTQPSSGKIDDGLTVYPNSTTKRKTNVDTLVSGFFSRRCTSLCRFSHSNATMFDATGRVSYDARTCWKAQ